jgi:ATP-dependent exoDNAse (exonuclease V) alpha subunit
MKEVVKGAAQGHTSEALEILEQHKKINVYQDAAQARGALVKDYIEKNAQDYSKGIVITNRAYDAQTINEEIRSKLQEQGQVKEKGLEFDNGRRIVEIAKGDRVIFTRNDYDLDVRNGQRGMIERVHKSEGTLDVILDNGDTRQVNVQEYNHLDYGWASTTYKAQGATVEKAAVFGYSEESMTSQQNTYVQISRAREETKLYIVAGERGIEREGLPETLEKTERLEVLNEMKKSWGIDASKGTTLDHVIEQTKVRGHEYGLER